MKKTRPIRRKQDQATALMMPNGTKIRALVALTSQIPNLVEVPMMLHSTKIGALANYSQQQVKLLNLLVMLNLILALVTSTICLRMQMIGPLLGVPPTQPYLVTPLSNH